MEANIAFPTPKRRDLVGTGSILEGLSRKDTFSPGWRVESLMPFMNYTQRLQQNSKVLFRKLRAKSEEFIYFRSSGVPR